MPHALFEKHRAMLDGAMSAIATRGYWSAFNEMPSPKVYGETAYADGKQKCESFLIKNLCWISPVSKAGWPQKIHLTA
jgi:hypothetical protein